MLNLLRRKPQDKGDLDVDCEAPVFDELLVGNITPMPINEAVISDDNLCANRDDPAQGQTNLPAQIFIGYYAHIRKRDLIRYLAGYSQSHCNAPKTARFQIKKYQTGYLYELHDGGSAGGVLSSLVEMLALGQSAVIATASRKLKVMYSSSGPSSFLLNESDNVPVSPQIRYADKLTPMVRSGAGVFAFGAICFVFGFAAFAAGSVAEALATQQSKPLDYQVSEKETPASGLKEIEKQNPQEGQFIDRLEYNSGRWEIRLKSNEENAEESAVDEMQVVMDSEGDN